MKEFQDRRKKRRKLYSKTTIFILLVIVALLVRATWNIYQKEQESMANVATTMNQLKEIQSRHDLLQNQTEYLQTKEGQEEAIREKFQVAKDGEQVIVMVNSTSSTSTIDTGPTQGNFWSAFLDFFKKK